MATKKEIFITKDGLEFKTEAEADAHESLIYNLPHKVEKVKALLFQIRDIVGSIELNQYKEIATPPKELITLGVVKAVLTDDSYGLINAVENLEESFSYSYEASDDYEYYSSY